MKRMFKSDLLRPKANRSASDDGSDTPEANVARAIRAFCEAGKGNRSHSPAPAADGEQIDEVTYLPIIVESAESSPTAAKEALYTIRKQIDLKNSAKAYQQYNAIMLLRILTDNPGPTFTRNMDAKFLSTVKELYKGTKDPSVRQLLVETLEYFNSKPEDDGTKAVREWWGKERENATRFAGAYQALGVQPMQPMPRQRSYGGGGYRPRNVLPPPEELAARVSEAQTSAKLLMQILQSTPASEVLANQLITEFADRCSAASRSIQQFIEADAPPPDESTMLTLFETNEQLATSLSRHQMAIYSAKQAMKSESASRTNSSTAIPTMQGALPSPRNGASPSPVHSPSPAPQNTLSSQTVTRDMLPGNLRAGYSDRQSRQPQQQQQKQQVDNPFADPEVPILNAPTPPHMRGNSNNTFMSHDDGTWNSGVSEESRDRHPMADASPVSAAMPHGYQPYRY